MPVVTRTRIFHRY